MKKILCLMLTLTMFISVLYPCQSVVAEEVGKENAIAVGNEVAQMCAEYDDIAKCGADKKISTRLIVKANDNIDEYGAIDSVYGLGYAFLQYEDENSAENAKKQYENSGYTVEYDYIITPASTNIVTGSNRNTEWAYEETDVAGALDYYKSRIKPNINIALLDTGIDYNHELFKNRVVRTNADFGEDGRNDEMDKNGHGTNVAGVIAKSTPSNVKISAYKITNSSGYTNYSIITAALEYIKQLLIKPDIINISFGGFSILGTIVGELVDMGITVVVAAGNDNEEIVAEPIITDRVITVAATSRYFNASSYTNRGEVVDISAPGDNIYTAGRSNIDPYLTVSGTSLSSAFVSSAAAYVLMENRNYTPEQVRQEIMATAMPFKKCSCYYDFGAGIVNFSNIINGTRCKDVTANYIGGAYHNSISLELKCENSLVDIYYTTDGTLPTVAKGIKYTEPINLTSSTRIIAAAFARAGTPIHSKFACLDYYILEDNENEYIIEKNGNFGKIKAYLGNETNVVVPDIVNGIAPTDIGENAFKNSDIESIVLPDTVRALYENAFCNSNLKSITAKGLYSLATRCFYNCKKLTDIDFSTLRFIGSESFYGCELLNQDSVFPKVEEVSNKGFAGTYFKNIKLPNCTEVGNNAFENCVAQDIVLNSATDVGKAAFKNCRNLENLYMPKVTGLWEDAFQGCTNLKMIFAPKTQIFTASVPSNVTVYCSDYLTSARFPKEYADYKCTFVSPEHTAGLSIADSDGYGDRYIHINSDSIAKSRGGQIRISDNGLRFGFTLDENDIGFDFKKYAENIEYGFVYSYESFEGQSDAQINEKLRVNNRATNHKRIADKRDVDGTVSTYNLVFTGIPSSNYTDEISARAYVCIDGMYFYSPVMTRSFSGVANAVLNDDTISQDIKDKLNDLLNKGV